MSTVPNASATRKPVIEHLLWSVDLERSLVDESMLTTIYCSNCDFSERAFFRDKSPYCPEM